MFLDEPTSGLDPLGRLLVRDIISELRERGTTVFLNSHLLGEVEATCDRVAFVKQGKNDSRDGPRPAAGSHRGRNADQSYRPMHARGSVLIRHGHLSIERGRSTDARRIEEALPSLARWLVERGTNVYALRTRPKSLEEWFVEVMGEDQRPG